MYEDISVVGDLSTPTPCGTLFAPITIIWVILTGVFYFSVLLGT